MQFGALIFEAFSCPAVGVMERRVVRRLAWLPEAGVERLPRLRRVVSASGFEQVSQDIYIRVPAARESVFRAAVRRDGVPVSDIVQVWLDAGAYPSPGPEQADLIYRRVLRPLLTKARR